MPKSPKPSAIELACNKPTLTYLLAVQNNLHGRVPREMFEAIPFFTAHCGISQEAIAKEVGINNGALMMMLAGVLPPNDHLLNIAIAIRKLIRQKLTVVDPLPETEFDRDLTLGEYVPQPHPGWSA